MKLRIIYIFVFVITIINIILVLAVNYDLNGDGDVTFLDLQEIASHYHTKAVYNSTYDFNNDAKVDLFDLVGLAKKVNLSAGSSGGNETNGNIYGGAHEPVGFKPIFFLDGTSVNLSDNNPGIDSYIGYGGLWDPSGSPVNTSDANSNHVEIVPAADMPSGYAIRKWWFDVDSSSGFNGIATLPDISGYTPSNWSAPVGTKRTWYMRYVFRASNDYNTAGSKLPFFGTAGSGANDFALNFNDYVYQAIKVNKAGPDAGDWQPYTPSNISWSVPGVRYDLEILFTTESSEGAGDGEFKVWADGTLVDEWQWLKSPYTVRNTTGWGWIDHDALGLAGFQLLGMTGNGLSGQYSGDIYIDWGLFYVSASPD